MVQDLELALRSQCSTFRVVEPKSSGAGAPHFILSGKLAVRLYEDSSLPQISHQNEKGEEDQMRVFCGSFQLSVIIFIVPMTKQQQQRHLDGVDSSFRQAQRIANRIQKENKVSKNCRWTLSNALIMCLKQYLLTRQNK
jgi:hypothetical protein